jgi:hypothetical protein
MPSTRSSAACIVGLLHSQVRGHVSHIYALHLIEQHKAYCAVNRPAVLLLLDVLQQLF